MTLIEILMVIALIGLLISIGLPKLDRISRANVRTSVRRLGSLVKFCYDQAVLTGKLHRIHVDLGGSYTDSTGAKVQKPQNWTLEVAQGDVLPEEQIKAELSDDIRARDEAKKKEKEKDDKDKVKKIEAFVPAEGSASHYLPKGIHIVAVKSWRVGNDDKAKVVMGDIGIYCFPNGFIDDASIALQEEGKPKSTIFTVKTRSLTGRVDIDAEAPK